jgi:hypothetical protein
MVLGFPPARSKVDEGFPRRPPKKEWCHSKAAPRQGRTSRHGFLPTQPTQKISREGARPPSFTAHQHAPPRSCSHYPRRFETNDAWPARCRHMTLPGQGQQLCSRTGGAHLHRRSAVIDRTEQQGHTRPRLARPDPDGPIKPRLPCCNT